MPINRWLANVTIAIGYIIQFDHDALANNYTAASAKTSALAAKESSVACGVNALFVYLRCRGGHADYESIRMCVNEGARGLTMQQMKAMAAQAACPSMVLKSSISNIDARMLPAIALISADKLSPQNHFIVVISRKGDRLQVMDGTSGRIHDINQKWLEEHELRAYLCPAVSKKSALTQFAERLLLAISAIAGLASVSAMLLKAYPRPRILCAAVATAAILACDKQTIASDDRIDSMRSVEICNAVEWNGEIAEFSRCPAYDAANIGSLVLNLNGIALPYEDIWRDLYATEKEGTVVSLLDLKRFLESQNVQCRIIRCSPEAIDANTLPAVTLMANEDQPNTHEVSLLCMAVADSSCVVEGGSASIRFISGEQFRRNWSGVLLVFDAPQSTKASKAYLVLIGVLLGILACSSTNAIRHSLPARWSTRHS